MPISNNAERTRLRRELEHLQERLQKNIDQSLEIFAYERPFLFPDEQLPSYTEEEIEQMKKINNMESDFIVAKMTKVIDRLLALMEQKPQEKRTAEPYEIDLRELSKSKS